MPRWDCVTRVKVQLELAAQEVGYGHRFLQFSAMSDDVCKLPPPAGSLYQAQGRGNMPIESVVPSSWCQARHALLHSAHCICIRLLHGQHQTLSV